MPRLTIGRTAPGQGRASTSVRWTYPRPEPGAPPEPGPPPRPLQFVLADQDGLAVTPMEPYHVGERILAAELAGGVPIEVAGRRVGTVIDVASAPTLTRARFNTWPARTGPCCWPPWARP